MKKAGGFVIIGLLLALALFLPGDQGFTFDRHEYIKTLDITVEENAESEVVIVNIGRYSPFRRYSWFRAGDVIESVDNAKATIWGLNALTNSQEPRITYRRGAHGISAVQISLEKSFYGLPGWLN
ncbi:MAG: hypothetical protein HZA02_05445 [Nitrospinae bacterium]|nr:hypothetical protein [Nitrospinota bacterium]